MRPPKNWSARTCACEHRSGRARCVRAMQKTVATHTLLFMTIADFFGTLAIGLDRSNLFWSGPNYFGRAQIIKIGPEKSNFTLPKTIWTWPKQLVLDQNDLFGPKSFWTHRRTRHKSRRKSAKLRWPFNYYYQDTAWPRTIWIKLKKNKSKTTTVWKFIAFGINKN